MINALSADQHDTVLAQGLAVLVFRTAESRACQNFQPELDSFVAQHPVVQVWCVDPTREGDLAKVHGLSVLPTIVIYRDGLPARRFHGVISAADLTEEVDEVANADMDEEYRDWMVESLQSGVVGSPFLGGPY
ncbi:hypothetical protein GCM10022251_78730 [Phytohabitans flavus]|uniref:Thioredoxin domain-containing protein n=1 Tax=Phytohabitans flavus TaxID=1076124 RepID=A0A6F8XLP8_9ACTN|nr:thioredoxin family protein [Phytohabitans flavus]BCB74742.1 hypothetical protein Pflav_011520 [Phytohabitans flavus]